MGKVKYSEGLKYSMGKEEKSDLDRLTEGQEGREILIVATWLRPTKLIGLIDLFLSLICYLVAELLKSWIHPFKPEDHIWYMGLWSKCGVTDETLKLYLSGQIKIEEINDNLDDYIECGAAAVDDHAVYVNFTRILFTLSFISCIVCFVFGCLAYSNRERRIWYKTLGWILIAISLVTLVSLIVFPVGFLKHYPIYVNWFFGVGYGFGWAALCLNILAGVLFILGHGQRNKKRFTAEKRIRI